MVFADLSFYAPYDADFNLTVGEPAEPNIIGQNPVSVPGFQIGKEPKNAANFDAGSLQYGPVSQYLSGMSEGTTIMPNSFRLLFKPNFSGPSSARNIIFGQGLPGNYDSFYVYHSDDIRGPAFHLSANSKPFVTQELSDFHWDSNVWYYMGVSFDSTGAIFYFRELIPDAKASIEKLDFGEPQNWGATVTRSKIEVGGRMQIEATFGTDFANGAIQDVKIFQDEKWTPDQFEADYSALLNGESSDKGSGASAPKK